MCRIFVFNLNQNSHIVKMKLALTFLASVILVIQGKPQHRIVGGEDTFQGEVPFQAQILVDGQHLCGGIIVAREWILTAAQCAQFPMSQMTVVVGQHSLSSIDEAEETFGIVEMVVHPDYVSSSFEHDIALIKIDCRIWMDGTLVHPTILPPSSDHTPPTGSEAIVYGWGVTVEGGSEYSDVLQKVAVGVVADEDCRSIFGDQFADTMICAGVAEGGKDSCMGDSGGPMICTDAEKPYLCGITSWGSGCGRPGIPGVYTEVAHYADWIRDVVDGTPEKCQNIPVPSLTADEYIPKGNVITIEDRFRVYEGADKTWDSLLILVHDIYGWDTTTNHMQFADKMNDAGFLIAFPDYYYNQTLGKFPRIHDQNWLEANKDLVEREFRWEDNVREDTVALIEYYKGQGVSKFGIFGFCWGGKISLQASADLGRDIIAAGQVHPSRVEAGDEELAMTPNILLPASNDAQMEDYCERIKERIGIDACFHQRFDDVNHGFAGTSGNWADETIRSRAEEVIHILATRFCQYM